MQLRDRSLGDLNAYQIAGLAFFISTVAAIGTLLVLRRTVLHERPMPASSDGSPDSASEPGLEVDSIPRHFSESLIIPGFTATGETVAEADARDGHSAEGV